MFSSAPTPPPGAAFAAVLATIALVSPLSIHLFLGVIPWLKTEFEVSDALAQLAFSVSLFTMAFATLIYGALSDRFGRRPVLLSGLTLFLIGSVVSAFADSALMLVVGRVVQALGAGAGITMSRVIARDAYGPDALVKAIAYLTMAYTLGPFIAPPVSGLLIDSFGWRSVFWFAVGAGALIMFGAAMVLRETHLKAARLAVDAVGLLRGYGRLFARPRFVAFVLQTGFSSGTFFTIAGASGAIMQVYLGRSATEFGLFFLFCPAGYFIGNFIASRLSGKVRLELMVLIGSTGAFAAVATQAAIVFFGTVTPLVVFLPAFGVAVAQGLALSNAQAGAIRTIPELAGTASGIGVFMQFMGGATFSQLYGFFADGTPMPMAVVAVISGSLTAAAGIACYLMRPKG